MPHPEIKRYLRGKGLDFEALLLVAITRSNVDDLSHDGVQIEFKLPQTTWITQHMDQGVIHAFCSPSTRNTSKFC